MNDPLIGQHLGNYRIDSVIGRGGMATVYYGWDESLHRPVAVKVIDARYRDNPAYAERFLQEARAVATWRHDNILQVFYAGQSDALYYFAMEYVDGPDLSRVMKQYVEAGELMPHEDVLKIGRAVASALDYAHSQGIIHRDVKPSNVMVAKDGRIALADFGLALNSQQGSMGGTFGTPHYIAPEQARNSAMAVPQSDLYGLGVILYEMLTGAVPFDDPSPTALALQHLTQPPPPPRQVNPDLNSATEEVLLKALNKQPEDRYQTGTELLGALASALSASETAVEEDAALPPMPGVLLPVLSQMSMAERVSLYMPPPPPAVQTSTAPTPASTPVSKPSSSRPPLPAKEPVAAGQSFPVGKAVGIGIVLLLLLGAGWMFFGGGEDREETAVVPAESSAAPAATIASEPTEALAVVETEPTLAEIAAEATEVTETTAPVLEAAVSDTPAPEPATAQAADTPIPQATEPASTEAPAAAATPTPSGTRLMMLYDDTSFYLYNPNANTSIRVSSLDFESLDQNGNQNRYWFDGWRWSQFYSFVEAFGCVRLEMTKVSSWLRPSQCREYNSTITPEQDDEIVFWTARPDVAAFRVMWEEQEVGRCDVTANQCEVYLP